MAPRSSTAQRYIVDEVASPAATQRLFGVENARATELGRWAEDALRAVEKTSPSSKGARKTAKRSSAKRGAKKQKRATKR